MKKVLAVILLTSALSGCAVWDAYFMAKFDVNEYQYITRIRTHAQLGTPKCGTDAVVEHVKYIHVVSREYKNYAEMIPRNENSFQLANTLTQITDDFYKRYQGDKPPSAVYCKAKFAAIERSSENIQKVIGAKPR
jgi:hypothetical protein